MHKAFKNGKGTDISAEKISLLEAMGFQWELAKRGLTPSTTLPTVPMLGCGADFAAPAHLASTNNAPDSSVTPELAVDRATHPPSSVDEAETLDQILQNLISLNWEPLPRELEVLK
jgi:hypothetical protein